MAKVKKIKLYHIHDDNIYSSNLWEVGKKFNISKNYNSLFGQELRNINLEEAKHSGDSVCKREIALEEIRKEKYPSRISRLHCIWLCDEESLDYWSKILYGKIYQVEVTGTIFRSSASFLFSESVDYEEIKEKNNLYWQGNLNTEEEFWKAEYLFQGKGKVLERRI